jgi:AraC-like DNA-binding protein
MSYAAGLLVHPIARARIAQALPDGIALESCDSIAALRLQVFEQRASLIVAEPCDCQGQVTWPILSEIRQAFVDLPIVAYFTTRASFSQYLPELSLAGVHDFVQFDVDDEPSLLRARLMRARTLSIGDWAYTELRPVLDQRIEAFVRYCLLNADHRMTVDDVAVALAVNRRTLVNRCDGTSLTPENVISWCRILIASRLLDDVGRPIEKIALELDFPSANTLRNMLQHYVGLSPTELRSRGASRTVLAAFESALGSPRIGTVTIGDAAPPEVAVS